jgi:hypothetical protein
MADDTEYEATSSGTTSLEGYFYQLDFSVWAALDLLLAKKLAQSIVLEPASQEDLEAELSEHEPGALAANVELASVRLVLQAKLRNTGPWKVGEFVTLLKHGTRRVSAAQRLKDKHIFYLLATSADVDGVLRGLRVADFGERPKYADLPLTVADAVGQDAAGRIGILASADEERIAWKLQKLLEEAFRVPRAQREACIKALREEALARMRGAGGGVWTRNELAEVIRNSEGYLAGSPEAEVFVRPTNWDDLKTTLATNHAVIITGSSGTGKTMAAQVLLAELRARVPGLTTVPILHGPEQVRADAHKGPVVFMIEDPWGRYRFEPQSQPWNDELPKLLATASGNRYFIVTSRSDVLRESRAKASKKWYVELEAENYGVRERVLLFEGRLLGVPRRFQKAATDNRSIALDRLRTPLEIQKYFDSLAEGPEQDEKDRTFVERCIKEAHRDSIESTIVQQVTKREAWEWAAIVWGLLKARARQSRALLPNIQAALTERDAPLEDGLEPFVNFLVNGRNLRQVESAISYYHPRVEAGLATAMGQRPGRSARVLGYLMDTLLNLDRTDANDWGNESAANLAQAIRREKGLANAIPQKVQAELDAWIAKRLSKPGEEFRNDLGLAADIGSAASAPAELARWLLNIKKGGTFFGQAWSPEPDTPEWYTRIAADPMTAPLCDTFVTNVLPFERDYYPDDFADHIARLAPGITPAFVKAASSVVSYGYDPNAAVLAYGAIKDLAAFEAVVSEAVAFDAKLLENLDRSEWLAISNGEYSDDYAQHLGDSAGEDGYTADVFIKAYVRALRDQKGWTALRDHPRVDGLVYAWINLLRSGSSPGQEPELVALAEKCTGHRHESYFWSMAIITWFKGLTPKLLERILAGCPEADVRANAAECFARHAADERDMVFKSLLYDNRCRLLELVLDLRAACRYKEEREAIEPFAKGMIAAMPAPLTEIAQVMFDHVEPTPPLSAAAVASLRELTPLENKALSLEKAKLLYAAGDPVGDLIAPLIASEGADESSDIDVAVDAIKLAVAQGLWAQVEAALPHRFADVRQEALKALASRSTGPLPANLLGLAKDKGSRVRQALLEIIKSRRAPEHLEALVILAGDVWSPQSQYYGQEADYPIAQEAAKILAEPPGLPETLFDPLIEVATKTNDSDVQREVLTAIAKNSTAAGLAKVFELALSREHLRRSISANWALFRAGEKIDATAAAQITIEQVTTRSALPSVPMVMTIGARGAPDQVNATANALSTRPKRKALLLPLAFMAQDQDSSLTEMILNMLPVDRANAIRAAMAGGPKLARDAIDDLGDVRIVEEVIHRLAFLFVPEAKA